MCAVLAMPLSGELDVAHLEAFRDRIAVVVAATQSAFDAGVRAVDPDNIEPLLDRALDLAATAMLAMPEAASLMARATRDAERALRQADVDALLGAVDAVDTAVIALIEADPVRDDRTPAEVLRWVLGHADWSRDMVARLLGTSRRSLQRWDDSASVPSSSSARLRLVARLLRELEYAYRQDGPVLWLVTPQRQLDGRAAVDVLDDPGAQPLLQRMVTAARFA